MRNRTRIHKNGTIIAHGGDASSAQIFSGIKSGIVNPGKGIKGYMKSRPSKKGNYEKIVADPLCSEPISLSVGI